MPLMSRPLHDLSATELKTMLDHGEIRSVDIVRALHTRADEVEPRVGAFAHQLRKEALAEASASDARRAAGEAMGMLEGLPITIKENIDTVGIACTLGVHSRQDTPAISDAVCVQVARAEGAVVLGKTNVPQTLLAPMETTNTLFGTTHNPWRHGHGPGGSSGGEGAAIASGSSIMGIGTDIGGSIRSPAALCGVCGIKPTVDRWSNVGSNSLIPGQEFIRAQTGPLARTVDDLILFMSALDTPKHVAGDPRVPPVPFGDANAIDPRTLRVGYFETNGWLTPAASVRRAVREAAEALEEAGVEVVRYSPINVEEILFLYFRGISSDGSVLLDEALGDEPFIQPLRTLARVAHMPQRARGALAKALGLMGETRVATLLEAIGEKRVHELWRGTARRNALKLEELAAWDRLGFDMILCPALATPAPPQGLSHDFTLGFADLARYNFLDMPAGVVPITRVTPDEVHRSGARDRISKRAASIEAESRGLPVGVQLVGRPWQEATLLAMMRLLETQARKSEDFPLTPVTPA